MTLKCLGSSSRGNCYLLTDSDGKTLIVEVGVSIADIKRALHFDISGVIGCLITHRHKDHSKSLKDVLTWGVPVLALSDVFDSADIKNRVFCKEVEPMRGYIVGNFKVLVLPASHDVPCVGFIIEHPEMGKLLFVTDTMMVEWKLPKLDHIMIEANYSDDILRENISNGSVPGVLRSRLLHSHLELGTLKEVLRINDISNVKELILMHLSGTNSGGDMELIHEIEKSSGKPIYIAKSGFELKLSNTPY